VVGEWEYEQEQEGTTFGGLGGDVMLTVDVVGDVDVHVHVSRWLTDSIVWCRMKNTYIHIHLPLSLSFSLSRSRFLLSRSHFPRQADYILLYSGLFPGVFNR
jgi:hypothetical protein